MIYRNECGSDLDKKQKSIGASIVIPFYNAERTILKCITSIQKLEYDNFEVILVDNNSNDKSSNIAQEIASLYTDKFSYIVEKKQGQVFARNCGSALARGKIIAFIDSDCLVSRHLLTEIEKTFADPLTGAVAGMISGHGSGSVYDKFHSLFTFRGPRVSCTYTSFELIRGGFPSANLAVRKEVFHLIGGFDSSFNLKAGEDYDLCARIYKAGFHIKYNPKATVSHIHRNSLASTWRQSYIFGTGHALLLKRHFKRRIIFELPRFTYENGRFPLRAWINIASADKKLFGIVISSIFWWPLAAGIALYLLWLVRDIKTRAEEDNMAVDHLQLLTMAFLLLFKSSAMTMGRIDGAIKNRVLCF